MVRSVDYHNAIEYAKECWDQLFFYPLCFCAIFIVIIGATHRFTIGLAFLGSLAIFCVYIFLFFFWFGKRKMHLHEGDE